MADLALLGSHELNEPERVYHMAVPIALDADEHARYVVPVHAIEIGTTDVAHRIDVRYFELVSHVARSSAR